MAYLDSINMFECLKDKYNGGATTYPVAFRFWRNQLLKFANNIFTWNVEGIDSKQIENRLLLCGCCGIVKEDNKLIAVEPMLNGITDYFDEYKYFTYATPLHHSTGTGVIIGKDGVLIDNDNLRNGVFHLIHRYAVMLAHTEITLINVLVNNRSGRVYVASTDKVAQSIREFRTKLYKGKNDVIVDKSFLGVQSLDDNASHNLSLKDLLDTRNNILSNFYEDMGVRKSKGKRERMNVEEVDADDTLLHLNILDMFNQRKKGAEEITRLFGVPVSVRCNIDIDGDGEEEGGTNEKI